MSNWLKYFSYAGLSILAACVLIVMSSGPDMITDSSFRMLEKAGITKNMTLQQACDAMPSALKKYEARGITMNMTLEEAVDRVIR